MKRNLMKILIAGAALVSTISGCSAVTIPETTASIAQTEETTAAADTPTEAAGTGEDGSEPREIEPRVYDNPYMGIKFTLPEVWYQGANTDRSIILEGYDYGLDVSYMTIEGRQIFKALQDSIAKLPEDATAYTEEQNQMIKNMYGQMVPICRLLIEYDGKVDTEFRQDFTETKELGEAEKTKYTLLYNQTPDETKLAEADKEYFKKACESMFELEKDITFTGYKSVEQLDGDIKFEGTTLEEMDIDNSIFIPYRLTAINIWATWCNPCVAEMPELQKVYEALPEGVNLIGICLDGAEDPELAKQIVEKTGVQYESVIANQEMNDGFLSYIDAYPTTIFVDNEGNIVGEPILGAPDGDVAEGYLKAIDEHLALLGQ